MTSTLDWAIWHTIVHHSLTYTYTKLHANQRNLVDGHMEGQTDSEAGLTRVCWHTLLLTSLYSRKTLQQ